MCRYYDSVTEANIRTKSIYDDESLLNEHVKKALQESGPFDWEQVIIDDNNQWFRKALVKDENNNHYRGEWVDGKKDGLGVQIYENGERYDGGWKNDMKHGYGRHISSNGDVYLGHFQEDLLHGEGCYKWINNGGEYTGSWKNNMMEG